MASSVGFTIVGSSFEDETFDGNGLDDNNGSADEAGSVEEVSD